jgi:biopolymer transport protein ExbD
MAANIDTQSGGRRLAPKAEVNVTPFVDVMLVLLIIFMVAAPLATIGIPFDLTTSRTDAPIEPREPVLVSLQEDGTIYVGSQSGGETRASWATLAATLRAKTGDDRTRKLLVRADQEVPYAEVVRLMDELQAGGYKDKVLVTEDVVD